ncbi:MAG TPA: aldehyde dehydrogenase family protein, partial [Mycobacterium sp.]|nr:aldehyde dehydrogenase family protein [Mycobacterium sp.]
MTATVSASVAGSWINGAAVVTGGSRHQVVNPANGDVVAELALATPHDVDAAVAAARAAQRGWGSATPVDRATVLAKLAALMSDHA